MYSSGCVGVIIANSYPHPAWQPIFIHATPKRSNVAWYVAPQQERTEEITPLTAVAEPSYHG